MKNLLSKTHFEVTANRLQHYSNDLYICSGCGNQYHPKVYSQPYIVQFGAILAVFLIVVLVLIQSPIWLNAFVIFIVFPSIYFYSKKLRNVVTGNLKYGDIIFDCPKCGDINGNKAL